jgi:hypothetical protein
MNLVLVQKNNIGPRRNNKEILRVFPGLLPTWRLLENRSSAEVKVGNKRETGEMGNINSRGGIVFFI